MVEINQDGLEEAYLEERLRLITDFPHYAREALKFLPKGPPAEKLSKGFVIYPLELNSTQMYVHDRIEDQLRRKGYVRILVLKSRQVGISTYTEGRFYWKVSNQFGKRCVIMTEADMSRDNLFAMVKTYHEHVPYDIKPATKQSNEKALIFDNASGTGLKSRYDVKTCDSKGGLGITAHFVHLSELAFYPDSAIPGVSGLLESMPSESPGIEGTEVIIESTAQGAGGLFFDMWKKSEAQEAAGEEPGYERIFVPWIEHAGYTLPDPVSSATLDDEEKLLVIRGANLCQLAWRRLKLKTVLPEIGSTPELYFKRWYPSTADEAFIHSGKVVFPIKFIQKAELEVMPSISRGDFEISTGDYNKRDDGETLIWQEPQPHARYVIGADVAEGLEKGDFSSADVLKYPSGIQVAHYRGHIDPDLFGVFLDHLGLYYNEATIGVEANNHGFTVLTTLKNRYYPDLFKREVPDAEFRGKFTKKIGWLTTDRSKFIIIDRLLGLLRDGESGIMNQATIDECKTFIKTPEGKFEAKAGFFDDRVMSFAIAEAVLFAMEGVTASDINTPSDTGTLILEEDDWG